MSDAEGVAALQELQDRISYDFHNEELLREAITHRSWAHERGVERHYERLEFLGDAVLGWLVAEALFEDLPSEPEGRLSKLKAQVVSAPFLVRHAREIGLGEVLRLGVGEERSGGRAKRSLLADAMEALIGAVYLDGGIAAVRPLVRQYLASSLAARQRVGDPKTRLQEEVQGRGWSLPQYRVVEQSGPDHDKWFVIECALDNGISVTGESGTKKGAEQRAARAALEELEAGEARR